MCPTRSHDFASPRFKADPYPFYARMRAEAPVFRTRWTFLRLPVWVVTRYDDVLTVLRDERFSKEFPSLTRWAPGPVRRLTRNLLGLDPPEHTRLRTLVSKAFTTRVVESLRTRIERACDELLRTAASNGHIELVGEYALPLAVTVIGDLLGVPPQDRRRFAAWSRRFTMSSSGALLDALPGWWGMWRFGRYFRELVSARRGAPQEDLVTALVQAEEAGDKLSEEELIAMLGLLLVAGYETTVNLIASGALALIQHPKQRTLFDSNPAFAGSTVEELLRFTSPLEFATPRTVREEITIGSTRIPAGALVLAALGSANRDESKFAEPETLDITREPNRHLAFGFGAHFCLGAPLARLEGRIALTTLFRRLPDLRLAEPAQSLRWRRGLLFRGLEELPLVAYPLSSSRANGKPP